MNAKSQIEIADAYSSYWRIYTRRYVCLKILMRILLFTQIFLHTFVRYFYQWHFDRVDGAGVNLFTVGPYSTLKYLMKWEETGINQVLKMYLEVMYHLNCLLRRLNHRLKHYDEVQLIKPRLRCSAGWLWREAKKANHWGFKEPITDTMAESDFHVSIARVVWSPTYPYAVHTILHITLKQKIEVMRKNGNMSI